MGKLTVYMTTQAPHAIRTVFALVSGHVGLSEERIRIVSPDLGGGFGGKVPVYPGYVIAISRVAIDAPSDPKLLGTARRLAELALDLRRISCITTPDEAEFAAIRAKALAHLATGGAIARMPHANQLWMLVGFALFNRLRSDWECLEVFPQATVALLRAGGVHKNKTVGLEAQLCAAARLTGWPDPPMPSALQTIGYGSRHALGVPPAEVIWVPRLGTA